MYIQLGVGIFFALVVRFLSVSKQNILTEHLEVETLFCLLHLFPHSKNFWLFESWSSLLKGVATGLSDNLLFLHKKLDCFYNNVLKFLNGLALYWKLKLPIWQSSDTFY